MSTPTDDPADFAACDDHQCTYPIGGSCPACDTDEARELAKRWLKFHGTDQERERLFAWVRERLAGVALDDRLYAAHQTAKKMGLALDDMLALCEAVGWPS